MRLLGDEGKVGRLQAEKLAWLAANEPSPVVRSQLAASAKRIDDSTGLEIVKQLLKSHPEESDERVSWLIWWAIESKALIDADAIVEMFSTGDAWKNPAARDNGLRLIRRYAAEGTAAGYAACLQLLQLTVADQQLAALEYLNLGLAERAVDLPAIGQGGLFEEQAAAETTAPAQSRYHEKLPETLVAHIAKLWNQQPTNLLYLELALRAGIEQASSELVIQTQNAGQDLKQLTALLNLLGEFGTSDSAPMIIERLATSQTDEIKHVLLNAIANWGSSEITHALLTEYAGASLPIRSQIRDILLARPRSALELLQWVNAGKIDAKEIPLEQLQRLASHDDESINTLVRKHWGNIGPGTSEEKLATMRRLNNDLRAAAGDPLPAKCCLLSTAAFAINSTAKETSSAPT
ncbi:MAG: hypothetical protein R3C56_13370 [Pirellulaceae bacterium]